MERCGQNAMKAEQLCAHSVLYCVEREIANTFCGSDRNQPRMEELKFVQKRVLV